MGRKIEVYRESNELVELVLGLLATLSRVESLLPQARADRGSAPDSPIADAMLGFLSFGRVLRANLASELKTGPEPLAVIAQPDTARDLLR